MIESGVATEVAQPLKKRRKTSEPKTFGKTAKVGALWSALRESVSQFLSIPTTVVLARLLSPTDFGIAAAAGIFIQFAKRLGSLGLNTALVRIKDVRQEHLASVFVVNLVIGLMTWVALMLAAPWIGAFYGDARVTGALRAASTIFIVNFFGAVEHAVLHRQMKFKEIAFVEWTYPAVSMPLSIAKAVAGGG